MVREESIGDMSGFERIEKNILLQGYAMKRIGVGPQAIHYWEPRYVVLSPGLLEWYVSHQMTTRKGSVKIQAGCVTMTYDREKFDEGRRRFVWGVGKTKTSNPYLFDAYNTHTQSAWVQALTKQNCNNIGHVKPIKKNSESVREGWIMKKELLFQTRYCIVLPQLMMYFKWKRDKSPLAVIPFFKNTEIKMGKQGNQFTLNDPSRKEKYTFKCYDKFSCKEWVDDLNKCIKKCK